MKGVSEIISVILILVITIALVATAFNWGLPLIQKTQGDVTVKNLANLFDQSNSNSLPSKIQGIFSNGGEETFSAGTTGIWFLYPCSVGTGCSNNNPENNSIQFTFFSKYTTNIGTDRGWISLSGASCPPPNGILGVNTLSVVCARADSLAGGFNITYRIWYRELDDVAGLAGQLINIVPASSLTSSTNPQIRLSRGNVYQQALGGKTLTITEIKILLG